MKTKTASVEKCLAAIKNDDMLSFLSESEMLEQAKENFKKYVMAIEKNVSINLSTIINRGESFIEYTINV